MKDEQNSKGKLTCAAFCVFALTLVQGCGGAQEERPAGSVQIQPKRVEPAPAPAVVPAGTRETGAAMGKVLFSGTPPAREALNMAADPVCSSLHPEGQLSENLIVNPDGSLRNVFIYVKSGLEGKTYAAPAEPAVLDQEGCRYVPHVLGVQTGQPVSIVNSDGTLHNVHALPQKSNEFNLGMPIKGMKVRKQFDAPEIMVKYKCDVHPWMNAFIGVVDHPFFEVTGRDGSFVLKDLPPGTYVLEAWHEVLGTQAQEIAITGGSETPVEFRFPA